MNYNHWEDETLRKIVSSLSDAGVRYIEIGNTLGLGSYRKFKYPLSDADFMRICMPCRGKSLIGMFSLS